MNHARTAERIAMEKYQCRLLLDSWPLVKEKMLQYNNIPKQQIFRSRSGLIWKI
ncbi:MAG: hypothetical protein V8T90_09205 [Victivallales bacterium]